MDSPEKLATLGTQYTGRTQTKQKNTTQHRKLKRWAKWTPPKYVGEPRCSRKVSSSCFV